jgi:preprotein translocase subunit SecY
MATSFRDKAALILKDRALLKKLGFVFFGLIIFRLLAAIPVPGVGAAQLTQFFQSNQLLSLFSVFSGSGLSTLSIVMLGVGPFITATIVMQLLTMISPKLKMLYQEEGEAGRMRFTQYARRLTVPLAMIQGYGFLLLLVQSGALAGLTPFNWITDIIIISAGSVLMMWLGELITEYGIGNGLSLIIFAGIVARIPQAAAQYNSILQANPSDLPYYIGFALLAIVVVWAVVIVTEAERPIPVTYAKQVRGNKVYGGVSTYLPLRVNQAGVIPIVFGLSILLFPQLILNIVVKVAHNSALVAVSTLLVNWLNNAWIHSILYFLLVFVFTYFYTAVTFDPHAISENLQKSGAFIPGIRPGQSTAEYLSRVVTRITLLGAVFLALIAVLPLALQGASGNTAFAIGGTALLIVVSVVLDLVKKIEGQVSMREY